MSKLYRIQFTKKSLKQLEKLDKSVVKMLKLWIKHNLEGCEDPRAKGKLMTGNLKGYWRYRVGDYRILADIIDEQLVIILISVAHRREVYK